VLDTCGFAEEKHYKEILSYVDLFLFDYKLTDDGLHKNHTGVSNTSILSNLDFLYRSGASIILRCPMIPGINDNDYHLAGVKKIIRKYPFLKGVEIMPYHNMGKVKADYIGMEYKLGSLNNAGENDKKRWIDYFAGEQLIVITN
jgi:pyruvate formate lyase activating enzyme